MLKAAISGIEAPKTGLRRKTRSETLNQEIARGPGGAATTVCPRRGIAILTPRDSDPLIIETNCKTWGCKSCRDRKLNLIRQMITYGLKSSATKAYLVSYTYSAPGNRREITTDPVHAERAKKDWRALLRALRRHSQLNQIQMFKVTELTRRLQIHHHTVTTGFTSEYKNGNCGINPDWSRNPKPSCDCLRCMLSRLWLGITHTSHIVDVREIHHQEGIATYLTSYLKKQMYGKKRQIMEERGFIRRFTKTNGWLSSIKVVTRGTDEEAWLGHGFEYGHKHTAYARACESHPLLERIGTPLALQMIEDSKRRRYATALKAMV